jgi:hypothetical protein
LGPWAGVHVHSFMTWGSRAFRNWRGRVAARFVVPLLFAVCCATLASAAGTQTPEALAQTPGPAAHVSLSLMPGSIPADGQTMSTATATVTDAANNAVTDDTVEVSSPDGGEQLMTSNPDVPGTYTAMITSSTTVGQVTITATDTSASPPVSGQATLTQTVGPASGVDVSLAPTSIAANGTSTSTATATVSDAEGHPISGDPVTFSSTDAGEAIGSVQDDGNGSYTATITSSTTIGTPTITASDGSVSGTAQLTQTGVPTATYLSGPSSATTNQQVTLTATATGGAGGPTGMVVFEADGTPIPGCTAPVAPTAPLVTCQTSFRAAGSPESLTASFVADAGTGLAGSTSAPAMLAVGKGGTTTSLAVSKSAISVGGRAGYTATVAAATGGPATPTGSVEFMDGASPITSCKVLPVVSGGRAGCSVKYSKAGTHRIAVIYTGDSNFFGSSSAPAQTITVGKVTHSSAQAIAATVEWTFYYTRSHTKFMALRMIAAPKGGRVLLRCLGRSCPFGSRWMTVHRQGTSLNLSSKVRGYAFRPGTKVSVSIVRTSWIGKYYRFTFRSGKPPSVTIRCLAPGRKRPGGAC